MMRNFRLGLLLVSVAVLVIFIQQNLSLVLPLTFLGTKTIALPLCLWILLALAAGGLTSGLIFMLLVPSSVQKSSVRDRLQQSNTGRSSDDFSARDVKNDRYNRDKYRDPDPEPARTTANATSSGDWEEDEENWVDGDRGKQGDRDWEDEENWVDEPIDPASTSATTQEVYSTKSDYEVPQEPISNYQAGTIYSYSYRSPENTGIGRTESVNDANYVVIVPPSSESQEDSGEYPADDYPSNDDRSDEYFRDEYPSDHETSEPPTGRSISETGDRVVQTNPTKIQTNPTKIQTDDEDDWSKPSDRKNDDWV